MDYEKDERGMPSKPKVNKCDSCWHDGNCWLQEQKPQSMTVRSCDWFKSKSKKQAEITRKKELDILYNQVRELNARTDERCTFLMRRLRLLKEVK